eukprot:TRINITY_DN2840_c0_g1_i2.p1 TRINITY_DN2840_c0_g1~~TRINITY_DN2840_c0_g1_i2.p1  ORF type:complete len:175 (-),score=9.34 TRINITY_DN2840_c0_g1_i2:3-527(-)
MDWIKRLLLLTASLIAASCGEVGPLPFPTPAQHDLVVLTRPGLLTYSSDDNGNPTGIEYDLTQAFAQELGVGVRYIVVEPEKLETQLAASQYHLAAAWLSPIANSTIQSTPAIFQTRDMLAQHEASLPLTERSQLAGKTVHVLAGTRQALTLARLAREIAGLKVIEVGHPCTLR